MRQDQQAQKDETKGNELDHSNTSFRASSVTDGSGLQHQPITLPS